MAVKTRRKKSVDLLTMRTFGGKLPGFMPEDMAGHLFAIEGIDGSGRTTQITLLTEWLESEGYSVRTMGLRRSGLLAKNIDDVLSKNVVTRLTLALLYATDFFDQLERSIIPALRSGAVVLADRYIFTLLARASVRGIRHKYLENLYQIAIKPSATFWLDIPPEIAFDRELRKAQGISYWESGRDMHLSNDLFESFVRYQTLVKKEMQYLSKRHAFHLLDGNQSIRRVNDQLRKQIAHAIGLRRTSFTPSRALLHYWQ